jgi:hypothetical protein
MKDKDKVKYGIYGANMLIPAIINATGKGNPGAFIRDLAEATSFNAGPAMGYALLDLASKASPKIRDSYFSRLAKLGGFVFYAGKWGLDLAHSIQGDSSALVDLAVDSTMLFNLGRDNYETYVAGKKDFLEDVPVIRKLVGKKKKESEE